MVAHSFRVAEVQGSIPCIPTKFNIIFVSGLTFETVVSEDRIRREVTPSFWKEFWEYIWYFLRIFLIIVLFYVLIRSSIFDILKVSGKSMFPNYNSGDGEDAIYIDQLTPRFSDYRRGDVVVLISPAECDTKKSLYVKRIIGLPGEQLVFKQGKVYIINKDYPDPGILLDESAYLDPTVQTYFRNNKDEKNPIYSSVIGDDQYFFMGDNRSVSNDSRYCGLINKSQILGREIFRVSPPEKRGWFTLPKYSIGN